MIIYQKHNKVSHETKKKKVNMVSQCILFPYGVPCSTIYHWKKIFRDSGGRFDSLITKSTAPKTKRGDSILR